MSVLSKSTCPDCRGEGIDRNRGGLCGGCHGGGKRRLTDAEEQRRVELSNICACEGGTAGCNGGCCY